MPPVHGIGMWSFIVTVPDSRPSTVVASFHVEPGGYVPCSALLYSGRRSSVRRESQYCCGMPPMKRLPSQVGALYNASTAPVLGSIATAPPCSESPKICAT